MVYLQQKLFLGYWHCEASGNHGHSSCLDTSARLPSCAVDAVLLLTCLMLCRTSGQGHEPSPSAAAAAELRALGAEGASRNRRLWECHKVAEQGAALTTVSPATVFVLRFGSFCLVVRDSLELSVCKEVHQVISV